MEIFPLLRHKIALLAIQIMRDIGQITRFFEKKIHRKCTIVFEKYNFGQKQAKKRKNSMKIFQTKPLTQNDRKLAESRRCYIGD